MTTGQPSCRNSHVTIWLLSQTTVFSFGFYSKQGLNLGSAMMVIKYSKHIVTLLIDIISKRKCTFFFFFFDGIQSGLFAYLRNKYGGWAWVERSVILVFCGCTVSKSGALGLDHLRMESEWYSSTTWNMKAYSLKIIDDPQINVYKALWVVSRMTN